MSPPISRADAALHAVLLDAVDAGSLTGLPLFDVDRFTATLAARGYRIVPLGASQRGQTSAAPRDTSAEAARIVRPRTGTQRHRILTRLRSAPSTCDELEQALGLPHTSCSPRVNELEAAGWIADSGDRRHTRNGAPAIVWEITRNGVDVLDDLAAAGARTRTMDEITCGDWVTVSADGLVCRGELVTRAGGVTVILAREVWAPTPLPNWLPLQDPRHVAGDER